MLLATRTMAGPTTASTLGHANRSRCGASATDMPEVILTDSECRERERANLMKALQRADGRIYGQRGAAELLGIHPTTLASRLRALKITLPKSR